MAALLIDKSVQDVLRAFASADPTPGGGSAAALASAVGTSLLIMVASLPKTRSGSESDRSALAAAKSSLLDIQPQLAGAIDRDTSAYDQVVAAYKLPKSADSTSDVASGFGRTDRTQAIQAALRLATEVPLGVARLSTQALELAKVVAEHGYARAASDVGVAVALLRAGFQGARLNVEANLEGLSDAGYQQQVTDEMARLALFDD
jgi:formiminotetrahydrofolate cyclodeaminase